jgi:hypothetical protein
MSYQLVNPLSVPPGEYIYLQEEGIRKRFEGTPLVDLQATAVSNFRRANGLPRATFDDALEDVVQYTCKRLGGHKRWCYETGKAVSFAEGSTMLRARKTGGCGGCGAKVR